MNWIERFRAWRAARREQKERKAFAAGYHWAATILRGEGDEVLTPDDIRNRCEAPFDGPNPFDRGAVHAVNIFEKELS